MVEALQIPLYSKQIEYMNATTPIIGMAGGRGTGKSLVGTLRVLQKSKPGETAMIIAPTFGMLRDATLKSFRENCERTGRLISMKWSPHPEAKIHTDDGGIAEVLFRSADDPDRLRGPNLSQAYIDEGSVMDIDGYNIVFACLRQGGKMGTMSMTFTPRGKTHWTYDVFYDADGTPRAGRTLIRASSWENPFLPPEFCDNLRQQYSARLAEQEIEGAFISLDGLMFEREWFEVVSRCPEGATHRVRYWDKASTHHGGDFSAGALLSTCNGMTYVEDMVRGQWNSATRERIMVQTARMDKARHRGNVVTAIEKEPGSGGKDSAIYSIQSLIGHNVIVVNASGMTSMLKGKMRLPGHGKVVRALPFEAQAAIGNVKLIEGPWNRDWLDEFSLFPEAVNDDQVDATCGAFNQLIPARPVAYDAPTRISLELKAHQSLRFSKKTRRITGRSGGLYGSG